MQGGHDIHVYIYYVCLPLANVWVEALLVMLETGDGAPIGSQLHSYYLPIPHAMILGQPQQPPLFLLAPQTAVDLVRVMVLVAQAALFACSLDIKVLVGNLLPVKIGRILELLTLGDTSAAKNTWEETKKSKEYNVAHLGSCLTCSTRVFSSSPARELLRILSSQQPVSI